MRQLLTIALILCFFSCKKEMLESSLPDKSIDASTSIGTGISSKDGRLVFSKFDQFDQLISQSITTEDPNKITSLTSKLASTQFVSYSKDIELGGYDHAISPSVVMTTSSTSRTPSSRPNGRTRPTRDAFPEYNPEDLIEDEIFAELVNLDGEIQVESTFYKISPSGTFIAQETEANNVYTYLDENDELKAEHFSKLSLTNADAGLYKLTNSIYVLDTYGIIYDYLHPIETTVRTRDGATTTRSTTRRTGIRSSSRDRMGVRTGTRDSGGSTRGGTRPGTTPVNTSNPFDNMVDYPFNSKHTVVGKFLQGLFGDPHTRYFPSNRDRRIRVNFYSKNWGLFSSVGVKLKYQKPGLFNIGWVATDDFQEMRIGWSPLVTEIDAPKMFQQPNIIKEYYPKGNAPATAVKMLTHATMLALGNGNAKHLTLRLSDVLDADRAFGFLSKASRETLETLINKAKVEVDYNSFFKKQLESGYMSLFNELKKAVNYPTEKKLALYGDTKLFIEDGFESQTSGKGKLKKHFDWGSVYIGWRADPNDIKNTQKLFVADWAKTIRIVSGSAYGAAKKNNEWIGISVTKQ